MSTLIAIVALFICVVTPVLLTVFNIINLFKKKKIRNKCGNLKNGAASKNRTCDPVITNDVLYH